MPPRFKFTREEIVANALSLIRNEGSEALTARRLAEYLGTSSKPIFGLFDSMGELQDAVIEEAGNVYLSYVKRELENTSMPPYKAYGMAYIRLAKEDTNIFKLLYMRTRNDNSPQGKGVDEVINILMEKLGLSRDNAMKFHLEMWVFVHGIATTIATNFASWDMDYVDSMLTDMYLGLVHRWKEKE